MSSEAAKKLTNIHHKPVVVESHGDFVRVDVGEPAQLTVWAALTLAGTLIRKAHESSMRYSEGIDGVYLAKCFRDAGFRVMPDAALGDLIKQLEEEALREARG